MNNGGNQQQAIPVLTGLNGRPMYFCQDWDAMENELKAVGRMSPPSLPKTSDDIKNFLQQYIKQSEQADPILALTEQNNELAPLWKVMKGADLRTPLYYTLGLGLAFKSGMDVAEGDGIKRADEIYNSYLQRKTSEMNILTGYFKAYNDFDSVTGYRELLESTVRKYDNVRKIIRDSNMQNADKELIYDELAIYMET